MTGPAAVLVLDEADSVGVALTDLRPGDPIGARGVAAVGAVPLGHKVALAEIGLGEVIRKLGLPIGTASRPIPAGAHVHTHNLSFSPSLSLSASLSFSPSRSLSPVPLARPGLRNATRPGPGPGPGPRPAPTGATFEGFVRADGRVGTRNMLLVLPTVNCSATVARQIAERFRRGLDAGAYPTIDGIVALTHRHGCSVRADGPGMASLRRTLAGYVRHPNIGGVLVIGLGCEDNQTAGFLDAAGLGESERLATRVIQQEGGTLATIESGLAALRDMLPRAAGARRATVSARHLVVGLQCGGSDGFSAISANPALGRAADLVVAEGGSVILSETPEVVGAESLLLDRAADQGVAGRLVSLLEWWQAEAARDGGTLDNNPSPGNKEGGITTILEKSLGAVAKAGSSPLREVIGYAEPARTPGLIFMDSPGFDPVSATGQVAAGANLLAFTTGRGSCFGCAPVPSLKIATNTPLFRRMAGDMDIDAGTVLDGSETHAAIGARIFRAMLDVASGRRTASESLGYGEEEFAPWTPGLTY